MIDLFAAAETFIAQNSEAIGVALVAALGAGMREGLLAYNRRKGKQSILESIQAQLQPNGGSTLKDALNRLESSVEEVKTTQAQAHADLSEKVDRLASSISTIKARSMAESDTRDYGEFNCDADGRCTWVNATWARLAGMDRTSAYGYGWVAGIYPEDREKVRAEWMSCVSERRLFEMRYRMGPNGTVVTGRAAPVTDDSLGWFGIVTYDAPRKSVRTPAKSDVPTLIPEKVKA